MKKQDYFAQRKQKCILFRVRFWCMFMTDYFNDVLITVLGLEYVSCVAVYAGSESSRIVPKMKDGLTSLERHGGWVINDCILIFGWTIPLSVN